MQGLAYNVRRIETKFFTEFWEYETPILRGRKEKKRRFEKDDLNSEKKTKVAEKIVDLEKLRISEKRREKWYKNKRFEISRIIDCNYEQGRSKFVTLTFKENLVDLSVANKEFRKFIKRLSYNLYNHEAKLQYIAVWERQKRGAIHYHLVLFDVPYLANAKLARIWRHGFVKIRHVKMEKEIDSIENVGRYISKYFEKNAMDTPRGTKVFFRSHNLVEPRVRRYVEWSRVNFEGDDVVYQNEYMRIVPDFNSLTGAYRETKVRYTKIRKERGNVDIRFRRMLQ